jgi:hypothetical protein
MAKPRSAKFETPTARLRLAVAKKPYVAVKLARGIHLLYRRNRGAGTWVVRTTWTKRIGDADDFEPADGNHILNFWQASERALALARGTGDEAGAAPVLTVDRALTAYGENLKALGGDEYNARRPRRYLTDKLLNRPVALLGETGATELAQWRDGLLKSGLTPAAAKRICICLRAALNLAAARDPARITHTAGWRIGLGGIIDANQARRVVMPDADVLRLVEAAFAIDYQFGLLVAVIAAIGAGLSQAARLHVTDLEAERCRLQVPSSAKGRKRKIGYAPVPIPRSLADMLAKECNGRGPDEPLLRQSDGDPWPHGRYANHQELLRKAAERAGLDPALTLYWLRHSSIVRSLLAGTPPVLVARLHDTSVKIIEAHYGKYILDVSDTIARRGLLDMPAPAAPMLLVPTAGDDA